MISSLIFLFCKIIHSQEVGWLEHNYVGNDYTAHGHEHEHVAPSEYDGSTSMGAVRRKRMDGRNDMCKPIYLQGRQ
jgi:hypothetical protein